jgi:hypothetical protein
LFQTLEIDVASSTALPTLIYNFLRFKQTLTTLQLKSNQIGDQGAQDLAHALQINKVTSILLLLFLT